MCIRDSSEVDLEQDKQRIRLARGASGAIAPVQMAPAHVAAPAPAVAASGGGDAAENPNIVTIDSPMVGTFYGRPNPESEAFVKVGDHISKDSVVCIIEAMKVFNEIQSEVSGKVIAVLAEDEESLEFGKALFKIDTSQ